MGSLGRTSARRSRAILPWDARLGSAARLRFRSDPRGDPTKSYAASPSPERSGRGARRTGILPAAAWRARNCSHKTCRSPSTAATIRSRAAWIRCTQRRSARSDDVWSCRRWGVLGIGGVSDHVNASLIVDRIQHRSALHHPPAVGRTSPPSRRRCSGNGPSHANRRGIMDGGFRSKKPLALGLAHDSTFPVQQAMDIPHLKDGPSQRDRKSVV